MTDYHAMHHPSNHPARQSADPLAGRTVLQVLPALSEGGVERGTVEIAAALAAAGAVALVASAGGRLVPVLERVGARHLPLPLMTKDPLNILVNAGALARLVRRERVDLVHARSRAPAWSAWRAARATRTPFVTTWHGTYPENLPGKRLYNSVMARGDRVIAISDFIARRVATGYGVGPDRLRTIHRGADPVLFDPARLTGDRLHKLALAWRIPDGGSVILLPGRITAWKGQGLLLEALALIPDPTVVAVFTGTAAKPRHAAQLVERARALGLADRLRFTGHCADMPAAYALADLVVAPSLRPEPFGRTVVEAQCMRRLVIVADHGGAVETVEHGLTGWRIPPGDAGALAHAIQAGLALPAESLAAFGDHARAAVLARFSTARMQAATLSVYREVLDLPEPPPAPDDHALIQAPALSIFNDAIVR